MDPPEGVCGRPPQVVPPHPDFFSWQQGVGREGVMLMMVMSSSSSSPSSSCCRSALMGTLPIIPGSQSVGSSSGTGVCNVKHNFEEGTSSIKLANSKLSHTVLCNHKEYSPRFQGCWVGVGCTSGSLASSSSGSSSGAMFWGGASSGWSPGASSDALRRRS